MTDMHTDGFLPVIIQITPVDMLMILGLGGVFRF